MLLLMMTSLCLVTVGFVLSFLGNQADCLDRDFECWKSFH